MGLDETPPSPSTRAVLPGTPDNFGPPFTQTFEQGRSPYLRDPATELARFENPPSLPATSVAGAADAAYAGPYKSPNGIWVHYPTGIYISIQKEPFDARAVEAELNASTMRREDGSPQGILEIIGGRETIVIAKGPVVNERGGGLRRETGDGLNWSQEGWHYFMQPNGPRPASLDLMKRVAASIP